MDFSGQMHSALEERGSSPPPQIFILVNAVVRMTEREEEYAIGKFLVQIPALSWKSKAQSPPVVCLVSE